MPTFRGFILQPTYRVESGAPVLHLFGRLEDGRPFLVGDRREVPHFYVERDDTERASFYGDTDSLFVEAGARDSGEARALGEALAAGLNRTYQDLR